MDKFLIRGGSAASQAVKRPGSSLEDSESQKKKPKFDNRKYDQTQRVRNFQEKWRLQFPWIIYDTDVSDKENSEGIMYCSTCREYSDIADKKSPLFAGTSSFRIDTLKAHAKNTQHVKCEIKQKGLQKTVIQRKVEMQQSPMGKAVVKMSEKNMDKFKLLFNTAYAVAKKAKPFTEYELMIEIQSKNGLDFGDNYLTSNAAKRFINNIAESIKQDFISDMLKSPYLCVLADGSTDSSIVEQEVVLVRYIQNGKPITNMISVEALSSGTSEGVKNGILNGLSDIGINSETLKEDSGPKVVGVNFDGAAVMMGCRGGAAKLLEETFGSHIIPIHCVAHKLELGVMDAVKKDSYLTKFEETTKGV